HHAGRSTAGARPRAQARRRRPRRARVPDRDSTARAGRGGRRRAGGRRARRYGGRRRAAERRIPSHRTDPAPMNWTPDRIAGALDAVRAAVAERVIGQDDAIDQALMVFLARGHALLEGVPGTAKTL